MDHTHLKAYCDSCKSLFTHYTIYRHIATKKHKSTKDACSNTFYVYKTNYDNKIVGSAVEKIVLDTNTEKVTHEPVTDTEAEVIEELEFNKLSGGGANTRPKQHKQPQQPQQQVRLVPADYNPNYNPNQDTDSDSDTEQEGGAQTLQEAKQEAEEKLEQLEATKKEIARQLKEATNENPMEIQYLKNRIGELNREIESLEQQIKTLNEHHDKFVHEIDNLIETEDEQNLDSEKEARALAKIKHLINTPKPDQLLKDLNDNIQTEEYMDIDSTASPKDRIVQKVRATSSYATKMQNRAKDYKLQKETLENEIHYLASEKKELENQINQLTQKIGQQEQQINSMNETFKTEKEQLYNQHKDNMNAEMRKMKATYAKYLQQAREQHNVDTTERERKLKQIHDEQKQKIINKYNASYQTRLKENKEEFQQKYSNLVNKYEQNQQELSELRNTHTQMNTEINTMQNNWIKTQFADYKPDEQDIDILAQYPPLREHIIDTSDVITKDQYQKVLDRTDKLIDPENLENILHENYELGDKLAEVERNSKIAERDFDDRRPDLFEQVVERLSYMILSMMNSDPDKLESTRQPITEYLDNLFDSLDCRVSMHGKKVLCGYDVDQIVGNGHEIVDKLYKLKKYGSNKYLENFDLRTAELIVRHEIIIVKSRSYYFFIFSSVTYTLKTGALHALVLKLKEHTNNACEIYDYLDNYLTYYRRDFVDGCLKMPEVEPKCEAAK